MLRSYWHALSAVTLLVVALRPAIAQTERGGGGASQKIMQEYQQLAAERTGMQAKIAQLQKDLDAAKADAASAKKERDALKPQVAAAAAAIAQGKAGKQAVEQSLAQSKQRMDELVKKFRETIVSLRDIEVDRDKTKKALSEKSSAFDVCADNNAQLFDISSEVLDRLEHVGLFTKVSASEPFTKITRTRLENLADDYRQRALELRTRKADTPAN